MPEALSATEVGKEISEHREHGEHAARDRARRERIISIVERPGYRPAVYAWTALHPLKNPHAPPDPSYMPQYRIPQETQARILNAQAGVSSRAGRAAAATADKYVRQTVLLAAVLFLVGIGSRFSVRVARYGLISVAGALLVFSVVQLVGLPGPPA